MKWNNYLRVGLPGRGGNGEIPSVIEILEFGLLPNTPCAGDESAEDGVDDISNDFYLRFILEIWKEKVDILFILFIINPSIYSSF